MVLCCVVWCGVVLWCVVLCYIVWCDSYTHTYRRSCLRRTTTSCRICQTDGSRISLSRAAGLDVGVVAGDFDVVVVVAGGGVVVGVVVGVGSVVVVVVTGGCVW